MELLKTSSGRRVLFTLLYLSEGAPIGFIWWALPTLLRHEQVAIERITTLTATLVLPWTLKFLWAPLVDALRTPRFGFRAWIIVAQTVMGLALLPLLWLDPVQHFGLWNALLLLHAIAAATQDVAVDALAINTLQADERGTANGFMQAGMLLGRSIFGGGAIYIAAKIGWSGMIMALIAAIWSSLLLVVVVREPEIAIKERVSFAEVGRHLAAAFSHRRAWLGLGFALVSAAAFEATGALAGPFLVDHQVSQETIGFFFGVPVVVATMIGGLAGGPLSDKMGRTRSVSLFLIGFVLMIVLLGLTEQFFASSTTTTLLAILTGMYFFIGLFTASSYALFMDLTDPALGATQFSTYMAGTNGCEAWSGWAAGLIVAGAGYPVAFLVMSAVSLLGLPLLGALRREPAIVNT